MNNNNILKILLNSNSFSSPILERFKEILDIIKQINALAKENAEILNQNAKLKTLNYNIPLIKMKKKILIKQ